MVIDPPTNIALSKEIKDKKSVEGHLKDAISIPASTMLPFIILKLCLKTNTKIGNHDMDERLGFAKQ